MKKSRYEEFYDILEDFQTNYGIFHSLVQMGRPVFTDQIQTAAVGFDPEGNNISFMFNPTFWDKSTEYDRKFVISHECLHVLLSHGLRCINCANKQFANIALDIVVNHTLVNNFRFDQTKITNYKNYCWLDTVFSKEEITNNNITDDKNFEYYYNLLIQLSPKLESNLVDDHSQLENISEEMSKKISNAIQGNCSKDEMESFVEKLGKEIEEINKNLKAGSQAGKISKIINLKYVVKKRKWETVIKRWTQKRLSEMVPVESWVHKNRRMSSFGHNSMMIPTIVDSEFYEKDKIDVLFFQDTSGSCVHLAERFLKAARSIPEDRFNVHAYCFDTSTYKTDLKSGKLYGFGGTSFECIEYRIQHEVKSGNLKKYPDAVFVITDGMGDHVIPEKPERWHWFLSYNYKYCIPKSSKIYMLEDFE